MRHIVRRHCVAWLAGVCRSVESEVNRLDKDNQSLMGLTDETVGVILGRAWTVDRNVALFNVVWTFMHTIYYSLRYC